jgi:hypothetical protein
MGAKMPLMLAQANEANIATDETSAQAVPLRALRHAQDGALRLAFLITQVARNGEIERTDAEIDALVYELYGLAVEEIGVGGESLRY